ncbi:MAG TPA: DUF805 domain-containing protein [Gaiellales bacterium]|jgi:uncharacterized membrane protein YhaH (DUF805 family)|nr:DUF805 domain-containing protein [Gaiellales bacterium]
MLHWYTDVIKQYAVFHGRAGRPEYWWFTLINFIISVALDVVLRGAAGQLIGAIYGLAVLLPSIGVAIRRLHDTNRTGWWLLVGIIPVVGWVWIIVLLALAGDDGPNRYGPPPGTLREPDTIVA